ncbi:hypothetical protein ANO11243_030650 [Dothideomycetidae sp. 11243]|nr:hypothetical protein ANO11243_030650 [fungal sp. No.11243]
MGSLLSWGAQRDEELGKKDDNYRPSQGFHQAAPWVSSRAPQYGNSLRWRRRRLAAVLLFVAGIYLIYRRSAYPEFSRSRSHVIGGMDFGRSADYRYDPVEAPQAPTGPPPRADYTSRSKNHVETDAGQQPVQEEEHYYSGPIKFYNLRASLDSIGRTSGHRDSNRNVLFAASSLKSAGNLLPLVCEMKKMDRNYVHFILLGRAEMPMDDFLKINGVDKTTCGAYFHDGRADYSEYSTDIRAEASVVGAMNHVNSWMHPQVVIMDDEAVEDAFFIRGMRGKMKELNRPVIEIPSGQYDHFWWLTRLSSASLSSWHRPRLEILVHSPANAGGGLARLLKSLAAVDFRGFRTPKLTVELPSKTDKILDHFLDEFRWPPHLASWRRDSDLLKVQKRIPLGKANSAENSIRFVESYFPTHTDDDHVLVLSPNAAVSPSFFHYVMYTLLQSRYSAYGAEQREHVAGLTLASPGTLLDGRSKFNPPSMSDVKQRKSVKDKFPGSEDMTSPSFMWQAPNPDAMLIFGNRWAEFHDYLTRRIFTLRAHPKMEKPKKVVSGEKPAWLEFLVELVRARAWMFIYPPDSSAGTWTTIHRELHQTPEEYSTMKPAGLSSGNDDDRASESIKVDPSEPFLVASSSFPPLSINERPAFAPSQPLHKLLPFDGDLPELEDLPVLSLDGSPLDDLGDAIKQATKYSTLFRRTLGGCTSAQAQKLAKRFPGKTGDLFCMTGKEAEEYDVADLDMRMLQPGASEDDSDFIDEAEIMKGTSGTKKAAKPRVVEELKGREKTEVRRAQDREIQKEEDLHPSARGKKSKAGLTKAAEDDENPVKRGKAEARTDDSMEEEGTIAKGKKNIPTVDVDGTIDRKASRHADEEASVDKTVKKKAFAKKPVDDLTEPMTKLAHVATEIGD